MARGYLGLRLCLSHYADTQGYSGCLLGVSVFAAVFYYLLSAFDMNICITDRTIKSQGVPSTELSVSGIGWLFVIDGAWPTGQPSKSIQTAGKDEMAGTDTHTHTCTRTPCLNGSLLFKALSIS